jgi:hypothetical protein
MAKDKITDYDSVASNNLDVGGISVAEGMLPSGVNNAMRELMSHQKEAFGSGTPLYVDQTNNRVGIGNAAPATALEVDANGATVATFDRATSDGTIIDLRKDGTTVGSIGTAFDDIYVGNGDAGLLFNASGDNIWPFNTGTQSVRDNAIDLGYNGGRFKDLYLSGGVYLGGTGSANHLDDYEEGTWTPVFSNAGTPSYTTQFGRYTKIGRVVYCTVAIYATGVSSGSTINLDGLPFSSADTGDTSQRTTIRIANSGHLNGLSESTGRFRINGSSMQGVKGDDATTYMTASQMTSSGTIQFATDFWYYTT